MIAVTRRIHKKCHLNLFNLQNSRKNFFNTRRRRRHLFIYKILFIFCLKTLFYSRNEKRKFITFTCVSIPLSSVYYFCKFLFLLLNVKYSILSYNSFTSFLFYFFLCVKIKICSTMFH